MLLQNSSCQHAVINAPVDLGSAHFVRFLPNVSLPHIRAGSASTSDGFGTFSMFICITAYSLADPQNGPLAPRCLRHFITSMPPLGCYRLERKLPGGFTPPLEFCAFSRRTRIGSNPAPRGWTRRTMNSPDGKPMFAAHPRKRRFRWHNEDLLNSDSDKSEVGDRMRRQNR